MAGDIFVWWLVLAFSGEPVVLPVPFPTQAACMYASEEAQQQMYTCIPQPAADLAQFSMLSSTQGNICDGMAEYVVHRQGADYGHCRIVSIYGVAQTIKRKEAMRDGSPS